MNIYGKVRNFVENEGDQRLEFAKEYLCVQVLESKWKYPHEYFFVYYHSTTVPKCYYSDSNPNGTYYITDLDVTDFVNILVHINDKIVKDKR